MQSGDRIRFGEVMAAVFALYGQSFSTAQLELWWRLLQRFQLEQIERALEAHAVDPQVGQFPPKPADIVRRVGGTHVERALRAWERVYWALVHVGPYQSVAFDDPIVHHVIAHHLGGWERLCMTSSEEIVFRQRDFEKAYLAACSEPPRSWPRYLVGIAEQANKVAGHEAPPPMAIGDPELARRTVALGSDVTGPKVTTLRALSTMAAGELPPASREGGE